MRKLKYKLIPTFTKKHMSKLRKSVTTKLQTAYNSFKILLRPLLNALSLIINLVTILFQTPTVHTSSNTSVEDTSLGDKEKRTTSVTATATSELAAANETITRLRLQLCRTEETVKAAESELKLTKKQAYEQKTATAMQKKEADQVKSELIAAGANVERLQTENDLVKREAGKLQSRLTTENAATETARSELISVKKEANEQKQELAAANAKVEEIRSQLSSEKGAAEAEKRKLETETKELITELQSQLKTAQAATKAAESKPAAVKTLDNNNYTFEDYAIMFIEVIIKRFKINIDWHAKVLEAYFDRGESTHNIKFLAVPSQSSSSFYPGPIQFASSRLAIQADPSIQAENHLSVLKENFCKLYNRFHTTMSREHSSYKKVQSAVNKIAEEVLQNDPNYHPGEMQSPSKIHPLILSLAHMASRCSDLCSTDPLIGSIATGLRCSNDHSRVEADTTQVSEDAKHELIAYIIEAEMYLASDEKEMFKESMCLNNDTKEHLKNAIKTVEQLKQTYRDMAKLLHKSLCGYTTYALMLIPEKKEETQQSVFDTIQNCEEIIQSKLEKDTSLQTDRPNPELHNQNVYVYNLCKARASEINNILQHKQFSSYLGCRYTGRDNLENFIRHAIAQKIIQKKKIEKALTEAQKVQKKPEIAQLQKELHQYSSNEELAEEAFNNYQIYSGIFKGVDEHLHNSALQRVTKDRGTLVKLLHKS